MSAPASTRRIDRGRGHSYLLDGERADGVTWITGNGVPKPALVNWAARTTASYAVDHWDELVFMQPSERLRLLEKARFAELDGAAARGTNVHALALALAAGADVDVPDALVGHIDSYLGFVEQWQPQELLTEVIVGNRRHRYMGTLDTVARLADGQTWLLDWKTGASGVWPETALQLTAYRKAEFYIDGNGNEQPMPAVDAVGAVWLRADGFDLLPVDASDDTFRVFLYAQQIARFTQQPRETVIGEALRPPEAG